MGAKQKPAEIETPEVETPEVETPVEEVKLGVLGDGREPAIEGEPKESFAERTQETQPWAGTEGVDDTRPEPVIEVKPKEEK